MLKISELPLDLQIVLLSAAFRPSQTINDFHEHQGLTPLMWLCSCGNASGVKRLLEFGADPSLKVPKGKDQLIDGTALHFAVIHKQLDCVKLLVNAGVNVNTFNVLEFSPLMSAAFTGHLEITEFLLQHKADPNLTKETGLTPLHFALKYGHPGCVKALIKAGANPNAATPQGITPIMMDYKGNDPVKYYECIELLMEKGVDPNFSPLVKSTARTSSSSSANVGSPAKDKSIISKGKSVLHCAIKNGNRQVVQLLLKKGVDVNMLDDKDDSPLIIATQLSLENIMVDLIRHNAKLLTLFNKPGLANASILFYADDQSLPRMVGIILRECLYLATLKYDDFQRKYKQLLGEIPPAHQLKDLVTKHLSHKEYPYLNSAVINCIYEPVTRHYVPREIFLTAYSLDRVSKHILPKRNLPSDIKSLILSFIVDVLGEKRRKKFVQNIFPIAIRNAELVSNHVSNSNIKILLFQAGRLNRLKPETSATTSQNLNDEGLWSLAQRLSKLSLDSPSSASSQSDFLQNGLQSSGSTSSSSSASLNALGQSSASAVGPLDLQAQDDATMSNVAEDEGDEVVAPDRKRQRIEK